MNIKSIFTAAVALILGLTACNKEESLSQDGLPENAVRIAASVGNPFAATRSNPVGTEVEQAKFNNGDKILVTNKRGWVDVIYHLDGTTWMPIGNKHHLWANNKESFEARYPINEFGFAADFTKLDQSTLDNLAMSDLMRAEIIDAEKADVLNFEMKRQTSRIIINIAGFNPEFPTGSIVKNLKIATSTFDGVEYGKYWMSPYPQGGGGINSTYTLLISDLNQDYQVELKVGEKEIRSVVLPTTEKGMSYTFNLIVGKEKLEIGSVTVADWTGSVDLDGGNVSERL